VKEVWFQVSISFCREIIWWNCWFFFIVWTCWNVWLL